MKECAFQVDLLHLAKSNVSQQLIIEGSFDEQLVHYCKFVAVGLESKYRLTMNSNNLLEYLAFLLHCFNQAIRHIQVLFHFLEHLIRLLVQHVSLFFDLMNLFKGLIF